MVRISTAAIQPLSLNGGNAFSVCSQRQGIGRGGDRPGRIPLTRAPPAKTRERGGRQTKTGRVTPVPARALSRVIENSFVPVAGKKRRFNSRRRKHSPPGPLSPAKNAGKRGKTDQNPEGKETRMSEPRMGGMKGKHI